MGIPAWEITSPFDCWTRQSCGLSPSELKSMPSMIKSDLCSSDSKRDRAALACGSKMSFAAPYCTNKWVYPASRKASIEDGCRTDSMRAVKGAVAPVVTKQTFIFDPSDQVQLSAMSSIFFG